MEDVVDVDIAVALDLTMTSLGVREMAHEERTSTPSAGEVHQQRQPNVRERLRKATLVLQGTRGKMHEERAP